MLTPQEIQAFYALSGVFLIAVVTVFFYFKEKVDEQVFLKTKEIFSSSETGKMIEQIKKGEVPLKVVRDFATDLVKLSSARRRLNSLFWLLPIIGLLFLFSALIASLISSANGFAPEMVTVSEYISYMSLISAACLFICAVYHMVRLVREL